MANKAIKDLLDIANGTINEKNLVSAVTKVKLYEAAGSLAFKLSIHQSKTGRRVHVPFFDDPLETKEIVQQGTERKPPSEHTKGTVKKKSFTCKFKWAWIHEQAKLLGVGEEHSISLQEAESHNPGCKYADLQNGMLNVFTRIMLNNGNVKGAFRLTTRTNKQKGIVIIKRLR